MSVPEQKSVDPLEADPFADDAGMGEAAPLGASPLGGPQPQPQPQQPRAQKPRSNVYTMMLILSFAAIVTACVLLWLHLEPYGSYPWWEIPQEIRTEIGS